MLIYVYALELKIIMIIIELFKKQKNRIIIEKNMIEIPQSNNDYHRIIK